MTLSVKEGDKRKGAEQLDAFSDGCREQKQPHVSDVFRLVHLTRLNSRRSTVHACAFGLAVRE